MAVVALKGRWKSLVYLRPCQSVRRWGCPGWSPHRAAAGRAGGGVTVRVPQLQGWRKTPRLGRAAFPGCVLRNFPPPASISHPNPSRFGKCSPPSSHFQSCTRTFPGEHRGAALRQRLPRAPRAASPAPRAAPGASPAPRGTGRQTPSNTFCCIWKACEAHHQPCHGHILLTGFNFISHVFDKGRRFLSPRYGVSRRTALRSCSAGGAAGAGCRRCGRCRGARTLQGCAGPQEVTQMYGLEGGRLSVCQSWIFLLLLCC